jgi:hypothetical protein
VRDWPVDLKDNLGITLTAKSKVVSRKLLVSVRVDGHPEYMSAPQNREAVFTLHFLDSDGFKIHSKIMPLQGFSGVVGPDGKRIGLRDQYEDYIDLDTYARFSRLVVEWTLDTTPESKPPAATEAPVLDHCAPNLSRSERLKRLGQHGKLRQTGMGSYAAGRHTLDFFDDGTLMHCR